jgi:tetratricopeptide (TPR) repeat protein
MFLFSALRGKVPMNGRTLVIMLLGALARLAYLQAPAAALNAQESNSSNTKHWVFDDYMTGLDRLQQGRWDEALTYCTNAIQKKERTAEAYTCVGIAKEQKGRLRQHLLPFSKSIAVDPSREEGYLDRGLLWMNEKKGLDQALADLTKAIEINPTSVAAYQSRGVVLRMKRQLPLSLNDFKRAVQLSPNDPLNYFNRALTYKAVMFVPFAIDDLGSALRLLPATDVIRRADCYTERGQLRKLIGDKRAAEADLRMARELTRKH